MFTKILYINLDRRPDRNEHMKSELKKINFSGKVERISAVDGRTLKYLDIKNLLSDNAINQFFDTTDRKFAPGSYMSKGAAGCALSHYKCWLNILNGNDEKVLILEDDIRVDIDFNKKIKYYLTKIPDYDLLYIGFHKSRKSKKYNEILHTPGVVGGLFGLFGYIVNKNIAKRLIDIFPIEGQIDSKITKIFKDIKVYHLNEELSIIYSDHSFNNSLGTDIQLIEKFDNSSNNNNDNNNFIIYIIIFFLLYLLFSKIKFI